MFSIQRTTGSDSQQIKPPIQEDPSKLSVVVHTKIPQPIDTSLLRPLCQSHSVSPLLEELFDSFSEESLDTFTFLKNQPLFKWAKTSELELIANQMDRIGLFDLERYTQILLKADLSHPFFQKKEWLFIAFKAYQQGLLNDSQIAVASHLDLFMHTYPDQSGIGSLDDPAVYKRVLNSVGLREAPPMLFKGLSPLERLIFFAPIPADKQEEDHVYGLLMAATDVRAFMVEDPATFLIPSPKAAEQIFKQLSPDHAVTLTLRFGYSMEMEDFLDTPHKRVAGIHCRYISQPTQIHDVNYSTPFDMYFHDISFHCYTTSFDPYRSEEDSLARFLWNKEKHLKKSEKRYTKLVAELADRPFPYHFNHARLSQRFSTPLTSEETFWCSVLISAYDLLNLSEDADSLVPFLDHFTQWHQNASLNSPPLNPKHLQSLIEKDLEPKGPLALFAKSVLKKLQTPKSTSPLKGPIQWMDIALALTAVVFFALLLNGY